VGFVSTCSCQARHDEYIRSLKGRIHSMAAAHSLLSRNGWQNVGLGALVGKQLAPYASDSNVTVSGEDIILGAAERNRQFYLLKKSRRVLQSRPAVSHRCRKLRPSDPRERNRDHRQAPSDIRTVIRDSGSPSNGP
jgi:hypothetical protein